MHECCPRQKWPMQRNVLVKRCAPPTPESIEVSHCCPQTSPEDVFKHDIFICHHCLKACATKSPKSAFASTPNRPKQCGVNTLMPFVRALAHASKEGWLRPPKASPANAAASRLARILAASAVPVGSCVALPAHVSSWRPPFQERPS